ncbi:MAG TPA: hypothetical protein VNA25_30215 [Phycisphaerae bacterium]|nr:hypothetical protein [Phycisphaerae bacterium]
MRVAIGGIVHDRWTIEPWFRSLERLDTTGLELRWAFVCDERISKWQTPLPIGPAVEGAVVEVTIPGPHYNRSRENGRIEYGRLATMRNILAETALGLGCDGLLSVDSDIAAPSRLLQDLVGSQKDWAAGLVRNSPDGRYWNVFKLREVATQGGLVSHFRPLPVAQERMQVGGGSGGREPRSGDPHDPTHEACLAAGAVCWYSRDLLLAARWQTDARGRQEDVGFALEAFRAGYRAWYVPTICKHLTVDKADAR